MNDMNYNLKRQVELLKWKKKVLSQNKSFFKENRAEALELSKHSAAVSPHIFWENSFEVASVIRVFLNKEIDGPKFHDSIFGLRRKHLVKCDTFLSKLVSEELKYFYPTKNSHN